MPSRKDSGNVTASRRKSGGGGRRMSKQKAAAERRRRSLREFMKSRDLKPAPWARRAGLPNANAIYNFLGGDSDSLSQKTLEALATAEGVEVAELTGDSLLTAQRGIVRLRVIGAVQAGRWVEAVEQSIEERLVISLVAAPISSPRKTYGLVVRGTSMNRLYPPGTILECIGLYDYDGDFRNGLKVIVHRRSREGLIEATCKELQVADGHAWLWPRSDDPEHQQPISVPWPPDPDRGTADDGAESITIEAVVIRSIRDEV